MMISILVAAFNAEKTLERAVSSAQLQTLQDWELIIIDDASRDRTCEIAQDLAKADHRVRLIALAENGGPSKARNIGLSVAKGSWIAILDADDEWKPSRLEGLIRVAQRADADIVADNLVYYDSLAKKEIGVAFSSVRAPSLTLRSVLSSERPWPGFRLGYLKPVFRAETLKRLAVRYDESLRFSEDLMVLCEMLAMGAKGTVVTDALYVYMVPNSAHGPRRGGPRTWTYDPAQRTALATKLHSRFGPRATSEDQAALTRFLRWAREVEAGHKAVAAFRSRLPQAWLALLTTSPRSLASYLQTTPSAKRLMRVVLELPGLRDNSIPAPRII